MQRRARSSIVVLAALIIAGCGDRAPGSAHSSAAGAAGAGGAAGSAGSAGGAAGSISKPPQDPPLDPSAVVIPNLDSAVINVDPVDGAKDYRAFAMSDGVRVTTDD